MNVTEIPAKEYKQLLQTYQETNNQRLFNKEIHPILDKWCDVVLNQFGVTESRDDIKQELLLQFINKIDRVIEANNSKNFTFTLIQNKCRDIFRMDNFRNQFNLKLAEKFKELYIEPEDIYNKQNPKELRF